MYIDYNEILKFYNNKRILVTGNTGFKGAWLTTLLLNAGASVLGYALKPSTKPNLYELAEIGQNDNLQQVYGDIRDLELMKRVFKAFQPEIVFHLAAQPIVRESYRDPVNTYNINVMGTVNICECVRLSNIYIKNQGFKTADYAGVRSFLNVTTDKVYKNNEWEYGYRENEPLDGYDPYSNSKSCSELVTHCYKDAFLDELKVAVSTARAGNVIGGGDFSKDRIIPDCLKTVAKAYQQRCNRTNVLVRNPYSVRPYQHVLEPLFVYLLIGARQYEDRMWSGYYNVGPNDSDCVTTGRLVDLFCEKWNDNGKKTNEPVVAWTNKCEENAPHEALYLRLDCSRIKSVFGWKPLWHIDKAIEETVLWTKVWLETNGDTKAVKQEMKREIDEFILSGNLNQRCD